MTLDSTDLAWLLIAGLAGFIFAVVFSTPLPY